MNQTLFLMAHEMKLMWKEFKFSIRKPLTKILITFVALSVIVVNTVLEFILSRLLLSPDLGGELIGSLSEFGLTSSIISRIIYFILFILLVSSLVRGTISSNFGFLFTRTEENIIIPSPIASHALYLAKKLRGLVLHSLVVATILLAGFPLITRIGFQGFQLAILFLALLALMEIYGLIENISFCLSRTLFTRENRINKLALTAYIAWAIFIVTFPLILLLGGSSIAFLGYLNPAYACSMILTFSPWFDATLGVTLLLTELFLFFLIASTIAEPGLRTWASSPRFAQTRSNFIQIRKNKLTWRSGKKGGIRLILSKDLWAAIRNPSRFFIPLAITLVLLLFAIGLQGAIPFNMQDLQVQRFTNVIFIPVIYLATLFVLSPAWDSFASERRTLYILKSSPIKSSRIVWGKYLFALMQSASYTIPMVATISILLPHTPDILLVSIEATSILLVSNALGILASVTYPPAYRGIGPPPFLILLGLPVLSIMLTLIIPISLVSFYPFITLSGFLIALMVFCVLGVARFTTPWSFFGLMVIIPIAMVLFYPLSTFYDFAFAFMLFYVFIVVTSCLNKVEKSFGRLEEFRSRY